MNGSAPPAMSERAIDHLVLPVDDLAVARSRFNTLGFTVAPTGVHPFGTRNANINFANGTFLEPLAIGNSRDYAAAVEAGNSFVRNDKIYREQAASEGLSHIVMSTEDAAADDMSFRETACSGGQAVHFARAFETPDGEQHSAEFLLAFASLPQEAKAYFFTCQRINVPQVDRSAFTRHANGAVGLSRILCVAQRPADYSDFLRRFVRCDPPADRPDRLEFNASNGAICILTPDAANRAFGTDASVSEVGFRYFGFVLGVQDMPRTRQLLEINAVGFSSVGNYLVVQPAPGQGALIAFEEQE